MRIYDNGGKTIDRFTIILKSGHCFGMSVDALYPQGFNMYIGKIGRDVIEGRHLGRKISYSSAPKELKRAILQRL